MYLPKHFTTDDVEQILTLMRTFPFACLINRVGDTVNANHLPLITSQVQSSRDGEALDSASTNDIVLKGHFAKANPVWRELTEPTNVLVIFQGVQSYISPSWYASKSEHGEVVPTWNYEVVHVRGTLSLLTEPSDLLDIVTTLSNLHENAMPSPWQVGDAPEKYIHAMLQGIVGFQIQVESIEAKSKLSQNKSTQDQQSIKKGLAGDPSGAVSGTRSSQDRVTAERAQMASRIKPQ